MGELGSLFTILDWALIGGSLVPHGGQNPIEALNAHCLPIHGPHIGNFKFIYDDLDKADGAFACNSKTLNEILNKFIKAEISNDSLAKMINNGLEIVKNHQGALVATQKAIAPYMEAIDLEKL